MQISFSFWARKNTVYMAFVAHCISFRLLHYIPHLQHTEQPLIIVTNMKYEKNKKRARVPVLKKHYELYKAANLSKAYWLPIVTQVMSLRQSPNMRLSRLMLINAAGADTASNTNSAFSF